MVEQQLLSPAQAGEIAGCSKWAIYKAVERGLLQSTRSPHTKWWRVKRSDLQDWISSVRPTPRSRTNNEGRIV